MTGTVVPTTKGSDYTNYKNAVVDGVQGYVFVNATSTSAAATANGGAGIITTESLTTAGSTTYSIVLTNSAITVGDMVSVNVFNGTNTQGTPVVSSAKPAAGSCTILINNSHTNVAFSGTLKIGWQVIKNMAVEL